MAALAVGPCKRGAIEATARTTARTTARSIVSRSPCDRTNSRTGVRMRTRPSLSSSTNPASARSSSASTNDSPRASATTGSTSSRLDQPSYDASHWASTDACSLSISSVAVSTVARLSCRAGRSARRPRSSAAARPSPRRASICSGVSTRARLAASSIARGMPSNQSQSVSAAVRLVAASSPGRTWLTLARNSSTDGEAPDPSACKDSGRTWMTYSSFIRIGRRLVASTRSVEAAGPRPGPRRDRPLVPRCPAPPAASRSAH